MPRPCKFLSRPFDVSDNPAELWTAYNNIGRIYEIWGRADLSGLYRQKATELDAAAAERLSQYKHPQDRENLVAALADALVNVEIEMEDQGS